MTHEEGAGTMEKTKITVKIYEPLLRSFDSQLAGLCIKRDAFVNKMLRIETVELARELKGKRLSSAARRYIAGELKRLGTVPVNIVVDKAVATELNAVVQEANIVRDAFINRLIIFLRSNSKVLKALKLPEGVDQSEFNESIEAMPTSPLRAMEAAQQDPLGYLRLACEERHNSGLYLLRMSPSMDGVACYLDDTEVPGSEAAMEMEAALKDLEAALNDFEEKMSGSQS